MRACGVWLAQRARAGRRGAQIH